MVLATCIHSKMHMHTAKVRRKQQRKTRVNVYEADENAVEELQKNKNKIINERWKKSNVQM